MPIVYPLIITLGYDPIWFGVILVLFIEMCCITPLVGVNLYTIHGLAPERPLSDVIMGSLPFFILMIVAPVLLTAFPVIATWLPYSMAHFRLYIGEYGGHCQFESKQRLYTVTDIRFWPT